MSIGVKNWFSSCIQPHEIYKSYGECCCVKKRNFCEKCCEWMESEKALPHLKSIGFQWGEKEPLVTFVYISIIFWLYSYSSFNYYYGKVHVITIFIHTHNMVLGNKLPRPWVLMLLYLGLSPISLPIRHGIHVFKQTYKLFLRYIFNTSSSFCRPRFFSQTTYLHSEDRSCSSSSGREN